MNEMNEISNPCYHCYMGAIGECLRCPISYKPWSGDLERETIEINDDIDEDKSIDEWDEAMWEGDTDA